MPLSRFPLARRRHPAALRLAGLLGLAPLAVAAPRAAVHAQAPAAATGRVTGRVLDAATGAGLADVGVQVVGTTIGTMTGADGRFTLPRVPAGMVTLSVRRIGFGPKTITGIALPANGAVAQDVTLAPATVQLQAVAVTASAERGSVAQALDRQRTATGIVNAVTQEQIARSPDADAAAAVQRVSGVNVQDGRYVVVRGLGERYTTASLNGARLPSPEPERRVVPLDLFPSALLQSVTTVKTFTPDQSGDFSGAQVDIQTREFPAERVLSFSASLGANASAVGRDVLGAPTVGGEAFALAGTGRDRPAALAAAGDLRGSTPQDYNRYVGAFRNAWSARQQSGMPNVGFGATLGGNDPILGRRIGYVGSLTYSNAQEVRADEQRGLAVATSDGRSAQYTSRFAGETGRTSALWGGVLNLSTLFGTSRLSLNNTYNRTADNEARQDYGFDENLGTNLQRTTLRYVERMVRSNQLLGQHVLGGRGALDWSLTSSGVSRREPDRSDLVYIDGGDGQLTLFSRSSEAARRTFGDLDEGTWSGGVNGRLDFGAPARQHYLKVGALVRATTRDSYNQSYSIFGGLPVEELARPAEEIFDGRHTQGNAAPFNVLAITSGGSYGADDRVDAYYGMVQLGLTDRLRLVGGARAEVWNLDMRIERTDGVATDVARESVDLLPSLALNFAMSERQNVRLSASRTLARPEYRELAPITYLDIIGGEAVVGNSALDRTRIANADLRWEWYPNPGELLSVAGFYKHFDRPIERVQVGTSGSSLVSFANAREARNFGLELEARKSLGFLAPRLDGLAFFGNATFMASRISLDTTGVASIQSANRAMVGQAPYLVNAGLTWAGDRGLSATLLYNVVGRRIQSASAQGLPDVYEAPRNVVDLSLRFPLRGGMTARLDARNLLDAQFRAEQGPVIREAYRVGRVFSLGFGWTPTFGFGVPNEASRGGRGN